MTASKKIGARMEFDQLKVLRLDDKPKIIAFEKNKEAESDDPLSFMLNWSAPWRDESLDHYLNLGWSMAHTLEANKDIKGYILAQPVLFFGGHTQSLWIESIRANSEIVFRTLLDAVTRVAKEKHLQQVFFHQSLVQDFESNSNGHKLIELKIEKLPEISFIKTTKWQ